MSENLLITIITVVLGGGGGAAAALTYFAHRSDAKLTAEGRLIEGYNTQVISYKNQADAVRLELADTRARLETRLTALEKENDEQGTRIWQLERENEDYKRCSSTTCPFRVLRLLTNPSGQQ